MHSAYGQVQHAADIYEAIEISPELFVVNPAYGKRQHNGEYVYPEVRALKQCKANLSSTSHHEYDVPIVPEHTAK